MVLDDQGDIHVDRDGMPPNVSSGFSSEALGGFIKIAERAKSERSDGSLGSSTFANSRPMVPTSC